MTKIIVATILSFILVFGGSYVYTTYYKVNESVILVSCSETYDISDNEMLLDCDVVDEDSIISTEYPLMLTLFDSDDVLVLERVLPAGSNLVLFDELDYNSEYSLAIDGYKILEEEYVEQDFFTLDFSTVYEDFIIPEISLSAAITTDTSTNFSVSLADTQSRSTSIEVTVLLDDSEVSTLSLTDFSDLDIEITELLQQTDYSILVTSVFTMNDYDTWTTGIELIEITTLRTPLIPSADISNATHDNITLEFNLETEDEDGTAVTYLIELIDLEDNVLLSFVPIGTNIEVDISEITTDCTLSVKSNYTFLGVEYLNQELETYIVYTNQYANFFELPTLSLVDTSIPLSNYDDYDDYLYTFYNEGLTEFTINCDESLDCALLVDSPLYSDIPFEIAGFIHPFYSPNQIEYSYTTESVDVTIDNEYTSALIYSINQEINPILDSIITEEMTDEDKIKAVHDYVINNSVYDTDCYDNEGTCDNDHTAMGILFDGNAVCDGYSHLVDIMLRALRIPSIRISSSVHQWNGVYNDGSWYHLDATWDDPVSPGGESYLEYDYFLIETTDLFILDDSGSHTYDTKYTNFIN